MNELVGPWEKAAQDLLLGKTVIGVRYMTNEELEISGWPCRALMLLLKGAAGETVAVYPSSDDEGNGPGALFTSDPEYGVFPVI